MLLELSCARRNKLNYKHPATVMLSEPESQSDEESRSIPMPSMLSAFQGSFDAKIHSHANESFAQDDIGERKLNSSAGNRRHQQHFVSILKSVGTAPQEADVFFVYVDV